MRVSPCAWFGRSLDEVKGLSRKVTGVAHNHLEGLKEAEVTVVATYLVRCRQSKDEIRLIMRDYYADVPSLDELRPTYCLQKLIMVY